jgi:hypothetical protein
MAQGEELIVEAEEDLGLFDRVRQFGSEVLEPVTQSIHEHRQKVLAVLAVGSAALGGGIAVDMLSMGTADAAASKTSQAKCEKYDKGDVSVKYASKAVMPLAREVVKAYHEAKGSEVEVKRNQPEMYGMTYSHLTEVDISVPARLINGDSGGYTYAAQFLGRIIPKDLVSASLSTYENKTIGVTQVQEGIYNFYISKTKGTVEDPGQGLQWRMGRAYVEDTNPDMSVTSKLADGFELPGDYTMTAPTLITGTRQAGAVIGNMIVHRGIADQKNLDVSEPSTKICG